MTTISDLTKWRSHPQWQQTFLYLDSAPAVFQFRTGNNAWPINAFAVSSVSIGAYTAADPGMLVCFGSTAGADDLGRSIVQRSTSSTLYTSILSAGTLDGEVAPMTNAYVTVYDTFPVFSKPPYIIQDGALLGTTYKDGTLDFATYGVHSPPLALINGGIGWADFVDDITNVVTLNLSATSSYATAQGATISSYLWDVKDGTITSGSTTTSAITITFPAGRRWIRLTVTDSNGITGIRRFLIVGCTKAQGSMWEPVRKFNWTRTVKTGGQEVKLQLRQAIPVSSYLDGMVGIVWQYEYEGFTQVKLFGPSGKEHVKFTGYHHFDDNNTTAGLDGLRYTTEFEMQDVGYRLQNIPAYAQTIQRASSPARWEEMANADIDKYLAYLFIWHSSASNVSDFTWSGLGSTYPFPVLATDANTMFNQLDTTAQAIRHNFTCDCYGQLKITPNPQLLITSAQSGSGGGYTGLPVRTSTVTVDLDGRDWWKAPLPFRRDPVTGWQRGSAIIATATDAASVTNLGTVFCISPGITPGQGSAQTDIGQQLCVNQTELNATMGHRYMGDNNPIQQLQLEMKNNLCVEAFSPALMVWVTLTITSGQASWRGRTLTSANRFLPSQLDITYTDFGQIKSRYTLDPENIGIPSATVIPPSAQDSGIPTQDVPFTGDNGVFNVDPALNNADPSGSGGAIPGSDLTNVALICTDGKVYQTTNFNVPNNSGGPTYTALSYSVTGTPLLWVPDFFSLKSNSSDGKAHGWLITTTNVYYGEVNTPNMGSSLFSFRSTSSLRSAESSILYIGRMAIATDYSDGLYTCYTLNGGSFFTEQSIGTGGGARTPGLAYSQHTATNIITSENASPGGQKSTDQGNSFSLFSGIDPNTDCAAEINIPFAQNPSDNTIYYGKINPLVYDFTTSMDGEGGNYTPYKIVYDHTVSPGWTTPISNVWIPGSGWQSVVNSGTNRIGLDSPTFPSKLIRIGEQGNNTSGHTQNIILLNGSTAAVYTLDGTMQYAEFIPIANSFAAWDAQDLSGHDSDIFYAEKSELWFLPNTPANKWGREDFLFSGNTDYGYWINGQGYTSQASTSGTTQVIGPISRTYTAPVSPAGVKLTWSGSGNATVYVNLYDASGNFLGLVSNSSSSSPITVSLGGITNVSKFRVNLGFTSGTGNSITHIELTGITNPSLQKYNGSSSVDVSPISGFGPWKSNGQVQTAFNNSNIVTCVAGNSDHSTTGVWISTDGAASWRAVVPPSSSNPYTRCFIANDKNNTLILVGNNGNIAISTDLGQSIDSRMGNISTSGEIIGIMSI